MIASWANHQQQLEGPHNGGPGMILVVVEDGNLGVSAVENFAHWCTYISMYKSQHVTHPFTLTCERCFSHLPK
jgi:hypothetical protein